MEQSTASATLEGLWRAAGFAPNSAQEKAIRHTKGPLFITAGPGSGKTRVLLWRTVNLIVFHDVRPEEIYLSTFTEKAAIQRQVLDPGGPLAVMPSRETSAASAIV